MKKIYLACPYAHRSKDIMLIRFKLANIAAGKLMCEGHYVFSPISHSHPISFHNDDNSHDFWLRQDYEFVKWADKVMVLELPGSRESRGVKQEIEWANDMGKPVEFIPESYCYE